MPLFMHTVSPFFFLFLFLHIMCVTIDNIQICFPYFIGTRTFFPFFFLPSSIYVNAVRRDFSVAIQISLFTPIFHFDFQVALLSLSTTELPLVVRLKKKSQEYRKKKKTNVRFDSE